MAETLAGNTLETMTSYYLERSPMSDPAEFAPLFDALPSDIPGLVRALQGLVIHIFWLDRYGVQLPEERKGEVNLRSVRRKLARILELDPRPLRELRPLEQRLVSNCRDFTLLCVAMLRCKGIPARARCGFGTYFRPGHYEDHWVVEYWKAGEGRWVVLDSQLDDLQKQALQIPFDTLDMPPGAFVTGGEAWQLCRKQKADPEAFGIFDMHGWDFIKGDMYRDILAINKFEILPWDYWPGMEPAYHDANPEDLARWDQIAALTLPASLKFDAAREQYERSASLHAPLEWAQS